MSPAGHTDVLIRSAGPATIVTAAADGTHFLDQYGNPRLFVCDIVWALPPNGGAYTSGDYQARFDTHFAARAAQGYTACEVSCFSWPGANTAWVASNDNGSDWDGTYPFTSTTNPSSGFNNAFWQRRDALFTSAAAKGITIVMNVTTPWLDGSPGTVFCKGWTTTQWQDYGTGLGNRYKNTPNILWIVGDDYFGGIDSNLSAWLTALRATGDTHLVSIQNYQEATSRQDIFSLTKDPNAFDVHAQYEWGYTYNVSYDVVEKAQNYVVTGSDDVQHVVPALWADGFFLASGVGSGQTDVRLERQLIWWALSSGACGFSVGDNDIWPYASTSEAQVTAKSFYTNVMPAVVAAFGGLTGWQGLAPDTASALVTAGRGTHASAIASGGGGSPYIANTDTYVTASRTADTGSGSSLAVIYSGKALNITIDQSKMKAGYTATWVDPLTGATQAGTAASTYNSAAAVGNNSAGDPDWVLVLRG
jgi:hypothetical protein